MAGCWHGSSREKPHKEQDLGDIEIVPGAAPSFAVKAVSAVSGAPQKAAHHDVRPWRGKDAATSSPEDVAGVLPGCQAA